MHKLKLIILPLTFPLAIACQGAEPFQEGVPLELVERITGGQVSESLPVDFPAVRLPQAVSVMGSLDNNFNQIVVLQSALPGEESSMAVADSFLAAGWIRLDSVTFEQPQNGFVMPNPPPMPVGPDDQFCHDGYGILTIRVPAGADDKLVINLINQALMQPTFSCRQQNEQRGLQRNNMGRPPFMWVNSKYMPRMELPESDSPAPGRFGPFGGGFFSGSDDDMETRSTYSGDMTAQELLEHFGSQLEDQGWQQDSTWNGTITAGSNWLLDPEPDMGFLGTFEIINRNARVFELKFRMLRRGNAGNGGVAGNLRQGFFIQDAIQSVPADRANRN